MEDNIIEHLKNIKLLQAIYSGKKFFVECYPTDEGAICFPNSNRAVKEIELPNFQLHAEKLGYKWVKTDWLDKLGDKIENDWEENHIRDAGLYDEIERLKLLAIKQFEECYIEMNPYAYNSTIQKEIEKFKKRNAL